MNTRIVADLHVHTTRSDGAIDPAALASVAARAGLDAVAITDHDRLPPLDAPVVVRDGVTLIGGVELRVETSSLGRVDVLAYGIEPTAGLQRLFEELQRDRRERARRMRDRLEDALGIVLDLPIESGIGRPHLARAVAARTELTEQAVFDRYIHDDGPCYVARTVPTFREGRRLLARAAELVALAHPLRYDDPAAAVELATQLGGIEYYYPYPEGVNIASLDAALADTALLKTGGSDAHDVPSIGRVGLDRAAYRPVAAAIGASQG